MTSAFEKLWYFLILFRITPEDSDYISDAQKLSSNENVSI